MNAHVRVMNERYRWLTPSRLGMWDALAGVAGLEVFLAGSGA